MWQKGVPSMANSRQHQPRHKQTPLHSRTVADMEPERCPRTYSIVIGVVSR